MGKEWLPLTDDALLVFVQPFSAKISLDPISFGVTSGTAATLAGLVSGYRSCVSAAKDPATRGVSTCFAKAFSKKQLVAYVRQVARAIQGTMTVTNQQRSDLGLTIRRTAAPAVPPPISAPAADVIAVVGRRLRVRLRDADSTRRARPDGVSGALLWSHVGEAPPPDLSGWRAEGTVTKTTCEIVFDNDLPPGATVWVFAQWLNPTLQTGPASTPRSVTFGSASMAA